MEEIGVDDLHNLIEPSHLSNTMKCSLKVSSHPTCTMHAIASTCFENMNSFNRML